MLAGRQFTIIPQQERMKWRLSKGLPTVAKSRPFEISEITEIPKSEIKESCMKQYYQ